MKVLGFNFTKINAEKFSSEFNDLKISTKIDVKSVVKAEQDILKSPDSILTINFSLIIDYETDIAKLDFEGAIIVSVEEKLSKDILKQWSDKKISEEFRLLLFNMILRKSTAKALELEEELHIPFHIKLPSIKRKED